MQDTVAIAKMKRIVEKCPALRYTLDMPRKSSAPNNLKRSPFNVREAVGSNIKRHRLALGWSQQELADRFGVSRAAVSQYEIGTGEVNAGDLPRLAYLLGISLLDFYERKPLELRSVDLRPVDLKPAQHSEGDWAVEADASLLKTHDLEDHNLLTSPPRGRPRDTHHRRPASLNPGSGWIGEGSLGEVDIAEEVVIAEKVDIMEEVGEPISSGEPAAMEQAEAAGQGSVNESEPGSESEHGSGGPAGRLFFRDHQFRVACSIVPALKQHRSHGAVTHLAELAGNFLSLSRRDQETLLQVAEALKVQTQHVQTQHDQTQREHTEEL